MNSKSRKSPIEIEKEFNRVKSQINQLFLRKFNRQIPPVSLFQQLDREFEKIQNIYTQKNDINLLHVTHNYYWSKTIQYLEENPSQSLKFFIISISKLLKRHEIRPYSAYKFDNMVGPYNVAFFELKKKRDSIDFIALKNKHEVIKTTFLRNCANSEKFDLLVIRLYDLFCRALFLKNIDHVNIASSTTYDRANEVLSQLKEFLTLIVKKKVKDLFLPSFYYENLYKIRKKQLHYLVRFIFFEESEEKKEDSESKVGGIVKDLIECSSKSFKIAKRHWSTLPPEKRSEDSNRSWMLLKELDVYTAEYYQQVYYKKDILKAWKVLDKIKQFLVIKALKENIAIPPPLLKHYGEEWSLLYIFTKICLLQDEVNKRMVALGQKWEEQVFLKISRSLEYIQKLFKYQMTNRKDYSLKIITSTFSGSFSEYFIRGLCLEYFEHGRVDQQTPSEFRSLFKCVKTAENKEAILLNFRLEKGKPDVDIYVRNECGVFLKNAKIESNKMKKIWNEIELCHNHKIKKVFYCINFIKNIEKLEYIRAQFQKIKANFKDLVIEVHDIKDLISGFLNELQRIGKSKLNFSQQDLYRVLDY